MDEELKDRTALEVNEIVMLLRLCLDATFVCFRKKYYQQTFGTAMGSPVSVTVANLVTEEIEKTALSTFHLPLRFWKRYFDDTCTAVSKDQVSELHQHLNDVNPNIQFTVEREEEGHLSFLDIHLTHNQDGSVDTSVHRKKTHMDRYLNFKSHHPLAHKRSVVSTLFKRAKELSSDAGCRSKEEAYIGRTLGWNGYPRRFVRRTAMGCHRKKSATATIPYVGGVSEPIKRMLEKVNVRVRLRPCRTLKQFLMKPKDRVMCWCCRVIFRDVLMYLLLCLSGNM